MRIPQRFTAKPLAGTLLVLACTGLLVLGLLALSLLLSLSRASHIASASSDALHPFTITSPDFHDGGPLSRKAELNQFGCTGSNIAPELHWKNVPAGTKSFVLLMSDYDAPVAGGFHHWIVYNIPANARQLEGNHPFTEGTTSFGSTGYGGPCPPATGETHHYLFLLYAIDIAGIGDQGLTFDEVVSAIQGHVLSATSIIGTFHLPQ
ncbi:MAG TPA: YbhB/YbcL family Raf kinase inhibitor-like protein [Ktedonobacteraceae bacterium]|jgi:Raf kinase inhibitor-like YbhB/YbcL family protein|nr:YbhB/YbcL family Raf kinase inhibitor-like protein [Ktedonobacteraceae bacterium]